MINNRRDRHRGVWVALAMTGLLLQACGEIRKNPEIAGPRVYAADVNGGAKVCNVPKLSPSTGKPAEAAMTVGNDGGWCGLVVQDDGKPFSAGLLNQAPSHGKVLIHQVGNATRIDYTPDPAYIGTDSFGVTLIPGDAALRTSVTVQPGR